MSDWREDWPLERLGNLGADEPHAIVDGPFGSNLKSSDYVPDGPVRVIRLGNIGVGEFVDDDRAYVSAEKGRALAKHAARSGDLVIAALAEPVGRVALVPERLGPAIVKADCIRFRPGPRTDARFLLHALNSPLGLAQTAEAAHGIGRLRINLGELRDLPVPVPPLRVQEETVAELDALRARSRKAKDALDAVPALLDRLRQSILAAAFRGDLTADWRAKNPDVEPASELLKRIRIERRKCWEEAELQKMVAKGKPPKDDRWKEKYVEPEPVDAGGLPELPDTWCWGSVDEVAWSVRNGIAAKPTGDAGLPILRISAVRPLSLDLEDYRFLPRLDVDWRAYVVWQGDVLVTRYNGNPELVGAAAVVPDVGTREIVYPDKLIRIRVALADSRWLAMALGCGATRAAIDAVTKTTSGQVGISGADLRRIPVPLAPMPEIASIIAAVTASLAAADAVGAIGSGALTHAVRLDAAVLALAFRGELVGRQSAAPGVVRPETP